MRNLKTYRISPYPEIPCLCNTVTAPKFHITGIQSTHLQYFLRHCFNSNFSLHRPAAIFINGYYMGNNIWIVRSSHAVTMAFIEMIFGLNIILMHAPRILFYYFVKWPTKAQLQLIYKLLERSNL